jgi:DNA-directed RNA polymerase specialized sigma24 family protein
VIKVLNKREREIFEAYFFQQLPPQEIASLFQTTTSNVYNILSRSRAKVQKERIRIYINHYVKERRELGLPKKRILTKPIDFIYGG